MCATLLSVLGLGCGSGSGSGGSSSTAPTCPITSATSDPTACSVEADCEGALYAAECSGSEADGFTCRCMVEGKEEARFESTMCNGTPPSESFVTRINTGCNWHFTP